MHVNRLLVVVVGLVILLASGPGDVTGEVLPIGKVQGGVGGRDGTELESPFSGDTVEVQGVIFQSLRWKDGNGQDLHGFFMQNLPGESDGDPLTSDGIFLFSGKYPTLYDGREQIPVENGLHVRIRGVVSEFHGCTQLSRLRVTRILGRNPSLVEKLETRTIHPPDEWDMAMKWWESVESMRGRIDAGAIVTGPSKTIAADVESYVWVIPATHPVAEREEEWHRRVFRDAHPLDDIGGKLFDNGNGYRIALSSTGLLSQPGAGAEQLIPPAGVGSRLSTAVTGAVYYSYGNFKLLVDEPPRWMNPSRRPSLPDPAPGTWSVVSYNVENLYDFRNDPSDPCDDVADPGNESVSPPFNYLPADKGEYVSRLEDLATHIVSAMHGPDMVMVQEIEDQDMDFTSAITGEIFRADGRPDVLQELASTIEQRHGLSYESASSRTGADPRGISCAFMIRSDRWRWESAAPAFNDLDSFSESLPMQGRISAPHQGKHRGPVIHAVNGIMADVDNSGGMVPVFSRALQIAVIAPGKPGPMTPPRVYLLNNHFSSIPDQRIARRTAQARLVAATAGAIRKLDPAAAVIIGGDLNVFPQPDDGTPSRPSRQLADLYRLGWPSAHQILLKENPALAYTYVYQGQAQTLDHLFFSPILQPALMDAWNVHLNADFPDHPLTPRVSDHDPVMLRFRF